MIIDTHTHFGKPSRPNPLLYRTELPDVYEALAVPQGVTGTVVVEARLGLNEIRWLSDLAQDDPFIVGIVGDIDPSSATFATDLESVAGNPLLVGVRLHAACCSDDREVAGLGTGPISPTLISNAEVLAARNLEMDVHVAHDCVSFDQLLELARWVPELRLVVGHIAGGGPVGSQAADARWAEDIRRLAEYPQVYAKVSALVQMAHRGPAPADVDYYTPTLDVLWDAFGEDRLVYGSNWPQIEAVSDYATMQRIVAAYFQAKGPEAAEKVFWKNAKSAYRWLGSD